MRARWRGWPRSCSIRRPARHGLGAREREWLKFGALLHDVGVHISYRSHHKHSHYLIRHGDLRGFDPEEVEIIALIARYHRQGDAEEVARRLHRPEGAGAAHRPPAVGLRPRRRGPRSQPLAGRGRPEGVGRRRRPRGAGRRDRRRRARTVGGGALPAAARDRARMPGPRRRPEPPSARRFRKSARAR